MTEDIALLRRFVDEGAEAAFGDLVRRRIDFVYGVALRQVGGDAHLARDVAQEVFCDLARKAATLSHRPVLVNWLYTSTRYAAARVVRRQQRWLHRQAKAHTMQEILSAGTEPDWEQLRPVLDEAMHALGETDRTAVLLRFFENRPLAEVGRQIGLAEHAAGRRVERALDKLRGHLARRGIRSTAAALGLAIASQPVVAAPAGLAASVTGAACAVTGAGSWLAALALMHTTKVVFGLAAAAGFVGTGIYLVADRPASAGAAIVSRAPPPSPPPILRAPAEIVGPVLAREVRFAAAAGGASEFQVMREASVPAGGYVASDLTPVINRSLRGGRDFERGRRIYESAGCAVCHRFGAGTQGIGPDLTGVGGRFGVAEILQAILEPSASISDLYALKVVHTRDARAFTGRQVAATETEIALVPNYAVDPQTRRASWPVETAVRIRTADILSIENSDVSLMPAGLINGLKEDEIADLIAYLVSGGDVSDRMYRPASATP